jgi:hypothetical protein
MSFPTQAWLAGNKAPPNVNKPNPTVAQRLVRQTKRTAWGV